MTVVFSDDFESGDLTAWTTTSATPPTVGTAYDFSGTYGCFTNNGSVGMYCQKNAGSTHTQNVVRFMLYLDSQGNQTNFGVVTIANNAQSKYIGIESTTTSGVTTLHGYINDGASPVRGTASGTIPLDTWIRVEFWADLSATAAALTWGWATGDTTPLTTVASAWTGGNSWGTGSGGQYLTLGSSTVVSTTQRWWDDVVWDNDSATYPIGPVNPQTPPYINVTIS